MKTIFLFVLIVSLSIHAAFQQLWVQTLSSRTDSVSAEDCISLTERLRSELDFAGIAQLAHDSGSARLQMQGRISTFGKLQALQVRITDTQTQSVLFTASANVEGGASRIGDQGFNTIIQAMRQHAATQNQNSPPAPQKELAVTQATPALASSSAPIIQESSANATWDQLKQASATSDTPAVDSVKEESNARPDSVLQLKSVNQSTGVIAMNNPNPPLAQVSPTESKDLTQSSKPASIDPGIKASSPHSLKTWQKWVRWGSLAVAVAGLSSGAYIFTTKTKKYHDLKEDSSDDYEQATTQAEATSARADYLKYRDQEASAAKASIITGNTGLAMLYTFSMSYIWF